MKKFEYSYTFCGMNAEMIKSLNEWGKEGWEVVSATPDPEGIFYFILKREYNG